MFDIADLERSRRTNLVKSGETGQVTTAFLFQIQESESEQEGEARVSTAP